MKYLLPDSYIIDLSARMSIAGKEFYYNIYRGVKKKDRLLLAKGISSLITHTIIEVEKKEDEEIFLDAGIKGIIEDLRVLISNDDQLDRLMGEYEKYTEYVYDLVRRKGYNFSKGKIIRKEGGNNGGE